MAIAIVEGLNLRGGVLNLKVVIQISIDCGVGIAHSMTVRNYSFIAGKAS